MSKAGRRGGGGRPGFQNAPAAGGRGLSQVTSTRHGTRVMKREWTQMDTVGKESRFNGGIVQAGTKERSEVRSPAERQRQRTMW